MRVRIWQRMHQAALIALCLFVCATLAAPLAAQSTFPIPGLSQGTQAPADDPSPEAPANEPPAQAPVPEQPSQAAQDLINILRDPDAREALIRELESTAPSPTTSEPAQQEEPGLVGPPPANNLGAQLLSRVRAEIGTELRDFVARVERIPSNIRVGLSAFERDIISQIIVEIAAYVAIAYGSYLGFRAVFWTLAKRLVRRNVANTWTRRLWWRFLATLIEIIPILLSFVACVFFFLAQNPDGTGTTAQAAFLVTFVIVELVRTGFRFFLSPNRPELRFLQLPNKGARSLQRILSISTIFLGYGQLVFVPAISEYTSVFIGRAFASILGIGSVAFLIGAVLLKRHAVAAWLKRGEEDNALDNVLGAMSDRWHVPVLLYLGFLFVVVATNTGNVLLPLFSTTLNVVAIIFVGYILSHLAVRGSSRRMRLPKPVSDRLPMLESRLNGLVPAFFVFVRIVILIGVVFALSAELNIVPFARMLGSDFANALFSGLFGVFVIAAITITLYLMLSSWVDYQLNPFIGTAPTPRVITLLTLLRNAVTIVMVVIALMLSLSQLGLDIGPLLASAGVLGLAISFGAQRMVEDIITGVFIQLENAMNVGDVVDVGGVVGTVEKLTVRSVTLRDLKGVVHMIPFSSASMISNYMRDFSYYVCDMGVAYRENVDEVKQAMFDAFEELRKDEEQSRFLLGDMEWFGLNSFDASAIVLRARIKTAPGQQWGVGRAYNSILKKIFDEKGIEIPFPHQTLYFGEDRKGNAPPVQVVLHTAEPEKSQSTPVTHPDANPADKTSTPKEFDHPGGEDEP